MIRRVYRSDLHWASWKIYGEHIWEDLNEIGIEYKLCSYGDKWSWIRVTDEESITMLKLMSEIKIET